MLLVVDAYVLGGIFPTDAFPTFPMKVKVAKLRKLESRGWIVKSAQWRWSVSAAGREFLNREAD